MTHLVSSLVQWDLLGRGMSILPQNLPGLTLAASGPSLSTWVCRGFLPVLKNASLVAQLVNSIPAMQETRVQSLGQEDPLQEMATHSSILAGRIPLTEEPGKLVCGVTRGGHDLATKPPPPDLQLLWKYGKSQPNTETPASPEKQGSEPLIQT